ncbi:hypothetical protein [Streptomyces halstedii]
MSSRACALLKSRYPGLSAVEEAITARAVMDEKHPPTTTRGA